MSSFLRQPAEDAEKAAYIQANADALMNTDLNAMFINNKPATIIPIARDSGFISVNPGDYLIVDCSVSPKPEDLIWVELDGQMCLRRLSRNNGRMVLSDDEGLIAPRLIDSMVQSRGTVIYSIRSQRLV